MDGEWKVEILQQLRLRNQRESGGFTELIASRTLLWYNNLASILCRYVCEVSGSDLLSHVGCAPRLQCLSLFQSSNLIG